VPQGAKQRRIKSGSAWLWRQDHSIDHRSHDLAPFILRGSVEELLQAFDAATVTFRKLRVHESIESTRV
jgi:hypothetical protein